MKARIKWIEDVKFIAEADSGHAIVLDGPPDLGGMNRGVRPMEMILMGLGGCTAFDVVSILKKSRQPVENCEVVLSAERSESIPKVFTSIHIQFLVYGKGLQEKQVKRAVELSAEKYCSASIMLGKVVAISHDYKILEAVCE